MLLAWVDCVGDTRDGAATAAMLCIMNQAVVEQLMLGCSRRHRYRLDCSTDERLLVLSAVFSLPSFTQSE